MKNWKTLTNHEIFFSFDHKRKKKLYAKKKQQKTWSLKLRP